MAVPILGRLTWHDYKKLSLAVSILVLESLLRFLAWLIPVSVIDFIRYRIFKFIPRVFQGFHNEDIKEVRDPIHLATTSSQLIVYHGYQCEEHVVITADGYFLVMHRIISNRYNNTKSSGGLPSPSSSATTTTRTINNQHHPLGPPVLIIHGAMMSSEIWVCHRTSNKNLAFQLVDQGFDVWLANRRGTRYSQKHVNRKPYDPAFWDYSLDETILHDVPSQVEHVLGTTGCKNLSLVGFSQGTTEIFGSLSMLRKLERRVNCVVAISATCTPPTPSNALIRSMVHHWTPELTFLIFGRRAMLKSVLFWQSILSPKAMAWLMDKSMSALFGWTSANIKARDKPQLYRHLFATASVKQIVHWFQIMRAGKFQVFDDVGAAAGNSSNNGNNRGMIVPEFPVINNQIPKLLIVGEKDNLIDIEALKNDLNNSTIHTIENYEHMDPIWANDAETKVFPRIIEFLKRHTITSSSSAGTRSKSKNSPPTKRKSAVSDADAFAWALPAS